MQIVMVRPGYCTFGPVTDFWLGGLDTAAFADRLWGDFYFDADTRKFSRKGKDPEANRTFVHFILEPLYKLYSQVSKLSRFNCTIDHLFCPRLLVKTRRV